MAKGLFILIFYFVDQYYDFSRLADGWWLYVAVGLSVITGGWFSEAVALLVSIASSHRVLQRIVFITVIINGNKVLNTRYLSSS